MKKKLKAFFKKHPASSYKSREIIKNLGLMEDYEIASAKSTLHQLVQEEYLMKNGKKYSLKNSLQTNRITGKLQITEGGYGFVVNKNSNLGDVFVAEKNLGTAFNGDTVDVLLFAKQKGKNLEGQIINVPKRKQNQIIGTLHKSKNFYFVEPDEPYITKDIMIAKDKLSGCKDGNKVVVGNLFWENPKLSPEGEILKIAGKKGTFESDFALIAGEYQLTDKFPPQVESELEQLTLKIPLDELKNRLDYRKKNVFTIDPADAKDFDDALSFEILENGNYSVGVHIADVSNYVKKDSALDEEAYNRGNSVYLVGKVVPMLPEKLSNNICSLVPSEDRLTFSVIIEITKRGKVVDYQIGKSVINSKRRFSYDDAQEILETGKGDLAEDLLILDKIAKILRNKRLKEGSIDFYSSEIKFELDEEGYPLSVIKKEIKDSNMLIEEYMLLANKIVAKHIAVPETGPVKPFLYRIHDLPDQEKLIEFSKFVKSLGYQFDPMAKAKSNQFQLLIKAIEGTPEEDLINELAIRSMAKAVYSAENIGHFGLGFKFYTHFTSPIRRYSDLIVHRMLFSYITGEKRITYSFDKLADISEHLSATERSAVDAERYSVKLKQIDYLSDKIDMEFDAVVSGVVHFGIFVKIVENFAEGLIRMRDLDDDFYVYDEKKYALIGRHTKNQYRLGDKLRVKLIRVDQERSEIDFKII